MPKPRSKRQAIREERKRKQNDKALGDDDDKPAKRQRLIQEENADETNEVAAYDEGLGGPSAPEREFYGMLSDQEQEYFRAVDEQLDIDDFPSQEERDLYLANVFTEAQGTELKLACSQSCSRLMERLILMANTRQKKKLFEQFATHFLGLIQHRFASHCCETLFLQSAPVVTRELGGERDEEGSAPLPTMEELFLLTLDEFDGQLGYLLTDKFASHTLRVLLIILSGRPLEESATKSLIHSKKKEKISAPWTFENSTELSPQLRAVPSSFTMATRKIIADSTSGMDATALRILATHSTGNPVLQLLLELEISLNSKSGGNEATEMTLLWQLLPGAPSSLKDSDSPATHFVNSILYDPIGSRLLETLITHCPGKLFKALWKFNLSDRIQSLVRNDIASYPAIRVLNRLSKEDLVLSIQKILPELPKLVSLSRLNVIKTLFERCQAREATAEMNALLRALIKAYGSDSKTLVPKLCMPNPVPEQVEGEEKKSEASFSKSQKAVISHGSQLVTTLLSLGGAPSNTVQTSLMALSPDDLLKLATSSGPTSHVLQAAFSSPAQNKIFHKVLVASLMQNTMDLVRSDHGHKVLSSIVYIPSKSDGINLPFHLKEQIIGQLGQHESELRESHEGRRVWKAWKGDLWRNRRTEWIAWAKEIDSQSDKAATLPWQKKAQTSAAQTANANMIKIEEGARKT